MSLILHLKIPGAIVAASDCRITGTEQLVITGEIEKNEEGSQRVNLGKPEELRLSRNDQLPENSVKIPFGHYDFIKTDSEQKTFLLSNESGTPFAVSYCGNANLLGTPTSHQIRIALSEMKGAKSTNEIAERFVVFWKQHKISTAPSILISGYNDGKASILELENDGTTIREHFENIDLYGVTYHGEQDVVRALIGLGSYQYSLFRLEDAINFCDLMITTTARVQTFQTRQQTVSEKYDLLVITEDKGQWIKRHTLEI